MALKFLFHCGVDLEAVGGVTATSAAPTLARDEARGPARLQPGGPLLPGTRPGRGLCRERPIGAEPAGGPGAGLRAGPWAAPASLLPLFQLPRGRRFRLLQTPDREGAGPPPPGKTPLEAMLL
ncbi:unnamed protein product [Rangifer tarandus platyrhynchus]|uniref:Uncharacterized protein n=1 Tax=Rangifer tarandus platyrhynchus TaxID=3082113 RepID=A0AC60A572_RANTA